MYTNVYPVIHCKSVPQILDNIKTSMRAGSDGCFLISHGEMKGDELLHCATEYNHPAFKVGVNVLGWDTYDLFDVIEQWYSPAMVWDDCAKLSPKAEMDYIAAIRATVPNIEYFGGVAFKYQKVPTLGWTEAELKAAAKEAKGNMDVLCTSGDATGSPPTIDKLRWLFEAFGSRIAVASGVAADNVFPMLPYVGHILVASSVSSDFHTLDLDRLRTLIDTVRSNQ